MPIIRLTTRIEAPIDIVFDLSRSVDLHEISTKQTYETAIGGVTEGLMELGDTVTWKARHFGIYQTLTSKITAMERPSSFVDEMERGVFKSFKHFHSFESNKSITTMLDVFEYISPLGILGKLVDKLLLEQYMTNFLYNRNQVIKKYAESNEWKKLLFRS